MLRKMKVFLEKHEEDGGQEDAYASGDRQRHDALMEHDDADDDRDNQLDRYKQRRVFRVDEVDAGLVEDRRDHAAVKRADSARLFFFCCPEVCRQDPDI